MDEQQPERTTIRRRRLEELEAILELAEELRTRCEAASMRIERIRTFQFLAIVFMLIGVLTVGGLLKSLSLSTKHVPLQITTGVSFGITIFLWILLTESNIRRTIKRSAPDRRALSKLTRLMRETEHALTASQRWSTLDRARFHIQLSRFDIGYPYYDPLGGIFSTFLDRMRSIFGINHESLHNTTTMKTQESFDASPLISSSTIGISDDDQRSEVRRRNKNNDLQQS